MVQSSGHHGHAATNSTGYDDCQDDTAASVADLDLLSLWRPTFYSTQVNGQVAGCRRGRG